MLLGFGYLYKFVMFYFCVFKKKKKKKKWEINKFKKKLVGQNFVILFVFFCFLFYLKLGQSGL